MCNQKKPCVFFFLSFILVISLINFAFAEDEIVLTDDFLEFLTKLSVSSLADSVRNEYIQNNSELPDNLINSYLDKEFDFKVDEIKENIKTEFYRFPYEMQHNLYTAYTNIKDVNSYLSTNTSDFKGNVGSTYVDTGDFYSINKSSNFLKYNLKLNFSNPMSRTSFNTSYTGITTLIGNYLNEDYVIRTGGGGSTRGGGSGRGLAYDYSNESLNSAVDDYDNLTSGFSYGGFSAMPYSVYVSSNPLYKMGITAYASTVSLPSLLTRYGGFYISYVLFSPVSRWEGDTDNFSHSFVAVGISPVDIDCQDTYTARDPMYSSHLLSYKFPSIPYYARNQAYSEFNDYGYGSSGTIKYTYTNFDNKRIYFNAAGYEPSDFYHRNQSISAVIYGTLFVYLDNFINLTELNVEYNYTNNLNNDNSLNINYGDNYFDNSVNLNNTDINIYLPVDLFKPIPSPSPSPEPSPEPSPSSSPDSSPEPSYTPAPVPSINPIPSYVPQPDTGDGDGGNIFDILGTFFKLIVDLFNWLFNGLFDIIKWLADILIGLIGTLLNGLKDLFLSLFVPSDDFWEINYNKISEKLSLKLPYEQYISVIESLKQNTPSTRSSTISNDGFKPAVLELTYGTVEFDWGVGIDKNAETIRSWIRSFFVILLALYNYKQILFILRGNTFK